MTPLIADFLGASRAEDVAPLAVTHLNIVVYAMAYWLSQPILPFLTKELGASPEVFGLFMSTFSFVQLVGGPIMGRICDTRGSRLALQISQGGSALSYIMLALSYNLPLLFASRLPTLAMHSMHAAQALVTDLTTGAERAKALGRLSLSYGVGMIVGASAGGVLSETIGYSGVAMLSFALSAAMLPLNAAILPRSKAAAASEGETETKSSGLNLGEIVKLFRIPSARGLIAFLLIVAFGFGIHHTTMASALPERFGLEAKDMGFMSSYAGVLSIVINSFVVGWATRRFDAVAILTFASVSLALGFAAYSQAATVVALYVLMIPLSLGSTLMYTLSTSVLTTVVPEEDTGTVIGVSHATRSLVGIVAPTAGGFIYASYGFQAIGLAAASLAIVGMVVMRATVVVPDEKSKKA